MLIIMGSYVLAFYREVANIAIITKIVIELEKKNISK